MMLGYFVDFNKLLPPEATANVMLGYFLDFNKLLLLLLLLMGFIESLSLLI